MSVLLLTALALAVDVQIAERGSGEPVGNATVTVSVDHGPSTLLNTDRRGRITIELEPGEHTVHLLLDEHESAVLDVSDTSELVRVFVRPIEAHIIVVEAFQDSPHTTAHTVDAEMAIKTPGAAEDSFRLLQSLPGVAIQRELAPSAGDLSIRGSGPGDNRVYLDGVEIPYLYHFNQYASVLPTSLIGELTLYSSTFGAQYGDAIGAVVEAKTRETVPAKLHGHVSMNFFMVGASVRTPIAGKWWAAVAARRSYQDLGGEKTAQYTLWPRFHDYHARVERRTDTSRFAFFAYGAGDRYNRAAGELDVLDPVEQQDIATFDYRRAFDAFGALHEWAGSGRGRIVAALIAERNRGELSAGGLQQQRSTYISSRLDWSVHSPIGRVSTGYEMRAERSTLLVESGGAAGILVAEEAPALARGVSVDEAKLRLRGGLYADIALGNDSISIIPGVRLPIDTAVALQWPDPRLAVRWRVDDELQLKFAAGRYQQAPDTEHLLPRTGDPTLPVTHAWQISTGVEKTVANRWEFILDGYIKSIDNPLVFPVDRPAEVAEAGRAMGVELITRYRLLEQFFLRGWLAIARSQVRQDGEWHPGDGDQPLSVGFVASWDFATDWNLGIRYRYGSGLPFTPIQSSIYNAGEDTWSPVAGATNSSRFPGYHKVDLRLARTFTFKRWSLQTAAELWYVPKASAQLYTTYNYDYSEEGYVTGPSFLPLLSARATF